MSDSLRSKLIRLAHTHPEFRDDLLPLLKSADQDAPNNWYGLDPKKPGITEPAVEPKQAADRVGKLMSRQEAILKAYLQQAGSRAVMDYDSLPSNVRDALVRVKDQETLWSDVERWLGDNRQMPADRFDRWAAWENLPKGWTQESVKSMWNTMTGDAKHKITKCMKEMEGKVDNTGAFCGSLASEVGYKRASNTVGDASLLRKAIIRVAHENPSLRTLLLPLLPRRA